jgi:hypothetical protein
MTLHGLPLPKWEYDPGEQATQELIRAYGGPQQRHVKIGSSQWPQQEELQATHERESRMQAEAAEWNAQEDSGEVS